MSWEMATARLLISGGVQILWVIARVQEGKTLLGYQIVAILSLGGGRRERKKLAHNKDYFFWCRVCHILMLLTRTSEAMHGDRAGLGQVHFNTKGTEEI